MGKLRFIWSNTNKVAFWFTLTTSVTLIVISFILPPQGAIDPSVLAATGELVGFATLATVIDGIEKGKKVSFNKGDASMTINDEQEEREEGL